MKLINRGNVKEKEPPKLPWWIGKIVKCSKCNATYVIEPTDENRFVKLWTHNPLCDKAIYCETPDCSTLISFSKYKWQ